MATTVSFYNDAVKLILDHTIHLATDDLKCILLDGYTYSAAHTQLTDVSSFEIATSNGYTAGGKLLTGKSLGFVGNVTTFDADDVSWVATGGSLPAVTGASIFSDTSVGKMLVCYIDFDGSHVIPVSSTALIVFNAGGLINFTK